MEKVVKPGNIYSGIPSPDIKNTHYSIGELLLLKKKKPTYSSVTSLRTETSRVHLKSHFQSYNKNKINHTLHVLALNQVGFQLKLIIPLQFILNQPQANELKWIMN